MEKQKAEQEVSALITVMTLVGMIFPVALVWVAGRFQALTQRLVEVGILEQSERVVLEISSGIGFDIGKLFILIGLTLVMVTLVVKTLSAHVFRN